MGSPGHEPGRLDYEPLHRVRILRSFAITTKEVTVEQMLRFQQDSTYGPRPARGRTGQARP